MYIGASRLSDFALFIGGFAWCAKQMGEPDDLEGFLEWLLLRFPGAPANMGWEGAIASEFDGPQAIPKFFELFDEFLVDKRRLGLEEIARRHREYCEKRYGASRKEYHNRTWLPLCESVAEAASQKLSRPLTPDERRMVWNSLTKKPLDKLLRALRVVSAPEEVESLLTKLPQGREKPDPTGWKEGKLHPD
jgi:hypothetical protein